MNNKSQTNSSKEGKDLPLVSLSLCNPHVSVKKNDQAVALFTGLVTPNIMCVQYIWGYSVHWGCSVHCWAILEYSGGCSVH